MNKSHKVLKRAQWEARGFSRNIPLAHFVANPLVPCRPHRIVRYVSGWSEWVRRELGYHRIPPDRLERRFVVSQNTGPTINGAYLYHLPRRDEHRVRMRPEYLDGVKEAKLQKKIRHATCCPSPL